MVKDEKIRRAAIAVCKAYGQSYAFTCPVCKGLAEARKSAMGAVLVSCSICNRTVAFNL